MAEQKRLSHTEVSKLSYKRLYQVNDNGSVVNVVDTEDIHTGCLQRIANSMESIAVNYDGLLNKNRYLQSRVESLVEQNLRLERKISSLKGANTKLKNKLKSEQLSK